ncbi:OmpP1/FadL family transporter [Polaribacter sp. Hel1_85]|uniref:OmpP1/FadL family transporter n=1 Tax=Polaribacter sp. Hel1_85 TaxID=1250005 RepID=UPI00052D17B0|nr:outer membrane protein transport protein [Polaribacter sp. Hel1_85]KGL58640.1 hemin receptor [Polaribacter sp. Hel1_85]
MKKFITIAIFFAATITSYSQSLGYQDLGILFSQNDENGSARFTAMSGAFGALGGDVSAMSINPAGIAIFKNSSFSGTFNSRNSDIIADYYGKSLTTQNQFFNLSHAGAVLVFDSAYNSEWNKFAIGFNYRITKDFSNNFLAQGNSGVATFRDSPLDNSVPAIDFNIADEQRFSNNYNGEISELNIAFSSVHQKKLYVGLGLNFYDLNFSQQTLLTEFNSDVNGNELDVDLYQENITTGTGFSANAGFIYKAHPNFRFGLAYQTPTWYSEILQDTNFNQDNDIDIGETTFYQGSQDLTEYNEWQYISYSLKTPSKLTASAAFIFGKDGLISFDYINKGYQNMKLSNGVFNDENQFYQNELRNTHSYNVGTEWRLDRFSVRGGYKFEQSPDILALDSDNLKGYSLGAGYNFGSFKLDFSYTDNNKTSPYNFYPGFNVNPAELQLDNKTITATVTLNL